MVIRFLLVLVLIQGISMAETGWPDFFAKNFTKGCAQSGKHNTKIMTQSDIQEYCLCVTNKTRLKIPYDDMIIFESQFKQGLPLHQQTLDEITRTSAQCGQELIGRKGLL